MRLVVISLIVLLAAVYRGYSQQTIYPQLYEISTRPWLYSLNISKLNQIPDNEFTKLKQLGIDIVWLMGVWQLGPYGLNHDRTNPGLLAHYPQVLKDFSLADVIGSPYAVVDYVTNPDLGTDTDLLNLKKKLNGMGLKLMLDFVPNHSAVDCPWTSSHTDYYIRAPQSSPPYDNTRYLPSGIAFGWGGYGDAWTDTAQFNYWNNDVRTAMISNLMKIASLSDYIRCDVAYLALNSVIKNNWSTQLAYWGYKEPNTEFWSDAISQVKRSYNVQFLGEVYNPWQQALQSVGFDFTYDKTLYDNLAGGNMNDIRNYITSTPLTFHQRSAHFVENHDEPRAPSFFGSNYRANIAAAISMTLPGMKFYFMWQEYGFFNQLDVHLRRETPENEQPGVFTFYRAFIGALSKDVFHHGTWYFRPVSGSGNILAWEWEYNDEKVLTALNYSGTMSSGNIVCPLAKPINGNDTIPVTELLTGVVYMRSAQQMSTSGLTVVLDSWSVQMFNYN